VGDVPAVGAHVRVQAVAPLVESMGCAVVVDADRRPMGIVTREDLEYARRRGLLSAPVSMVMREDPITAREDEPLEEAEARMAEAGVDCMPVVDGRGRLAGLVRSAGRALAVTA
ncbi:MAG: CBS domain-containing protein, partial [Conexivisphaera sp.]